MKKITAPIRVDGDRTTRAGQSFVVLILLVAAGMLALAGAASAKQIQRYTFQGSFTGTDSTAGPFTSAILGVAINQSNGRVYVLDPHGGTLQVSQFNAAGEAQNWSGLAGVSSFSPGSAFNSDMVYDNSGHGGGLYVSGGISGQTIGAFRDDGTVRLAGFGGSSNRCGIGVDSDGLVYNGSGQWAPTFDSDTGNPTNVTYFFEQETCHITFDTEGYGYLNKASGYSSGSPGLYKYYKGKENITQGFEDAESLRFSYVNTRYSAADPSTNDIYAIENGNKVTQYSSAGLPITSFGAAEGPFTGLTGSKGVAVNGATHDVYVTMAGATPRVAVFHQAPPITVPEATTVAPGHPSKTSAILKGVINPDGVPTTQCKFEWGTTTQYTGGAVPCVEGNEFTGSTDTDVSYELKSLTLGKTYHYRVVAKNANEQLSYGVDREFEASLPPTAGAVSVDRVNTDGARFSAGISPNGGTTHYHFEVGLEDCASSSCTNLPASDPTLESNLATEEVVQTATGLAPDTPYNVRLVAENGAGTITVPYVFRTYPSPPTSDPCPNAHVRQQTSTSLLPDCRAYELVSTANAGGYDVESDLVPGQTPFVGYPGAKDRVLYGLHFGSVPGIGGSPTNHGVDPYVAERGEDGWSTRYVGIPADGMADNTPFGSPLLAADQDLDTFAFGGAEICDPCFGDGSINVPLRLSDGSLIKGMAGAMNPAADPTGEVRQPFSADGSHFVFGADSQFELAGNNGSTSIYDRNLKAGVTQVVSTMPNGSTMTGDVAELAISEDGEQVLVGRLVKTDTAGNEYFDLYMHVGTSPESILIADTANGVSFSGMTSDGSRVFFTTADQIAGDGDTSADAFRADVGVSAATVSRVSIGTPGTGNTDACEPPGFPESWNVVSGTGKCDVVAFAGGAGVATEDGTFYFVSPEKLDGANGVQNQANLYVVKPGGGPHFVETIDSSLDKPGPAPPENPLVTANLTGESHSGPEALAIDQSSGDIYVFETGNGKLARYTSAGAPHNFSSAQPYIEGNRITGLPLGSNSASQVAVDNAGSSPFSSNIYATSEPNVSVFSPSGEKLGNITGSENAAGSFGIVCGVAVDQSNGTLYIGDRQFEAVWQYTPKPGAVPPITDSDYEAKAIIIPGFAACNVAADSSGHVYASRFANGPVRAFEASAFEAPFAIQSGTQVNESSRALATDPVSGELYVDEGNQIAVFNSSLEPVKTVGAGVISGSRGVALSSSTHHVYASSGLNIVEFGYALAPYHPIDQPAVVNGVQQAATYSTADFQVTPDGRFAVFGSSLSLTGFANLGHAQIYRYDSQEDEVECASCATTGAAAKSDTLLAPNGLNLSEDGRVFFTSQEGLVLSDTNEKRDAYQWSGGSTVGRISTGRSLSDSSLLTVSRDGRDVFFFTREVLVPGDENGGAVKIYTAREGGGYRQTTAPPPCAASDECHGPGTLAPPSPNISSVTGAGEEALKERSCKKGSVKRRGRCVRRKKFRNRNHKKRQQARRNSTRRHG